LSLYFYFTSHGGPFFDVVLWFFPWPHFVSRFGFSFTSHGGLFFDVRCFVVFSLAIFYLML